MSNTTAIAIGAVVLAAALVGVFLLNRGPAAAPALPGGGAWMPAPSAPPPQYQAPPPPQSTSKTSDAFADIGRTVGGIFDFVGGLFGKK